MTGLGPWLRSADVPQDEIALRRLRQATLAQAHAIARLAQSPPRWSAHGVLGMGCVIGSFAALAAWSVAWLGERDSHNALAQAATRGLGEQSALSKPIAAHAVDPPAEQPQAALVSSPASKVLPAAERLRGHARPARPSVATRPDPRTTSDALASEDTAYLRILRLWRAQRLESLQLEAADYLDHFPNGFRRIEVRQLLSATRAEPHAGR